MSFSTALSGIRAATLDLEVIGNNIANVSTTGFKQSRAEFADVYAASALGTASTAIGKGVRLQAPAQQFTQGNITFTDNVLDLAINGNGFFMLREPAGSIVYGRAGNFKVDRDDFIVDGNGYRLMAASLDGEMLADGLRIDRSYQNPNATTDIDAVFNLDSRQEAPPAILAFDVTDPDSFNHTTSTTVYDSLGNPHTLTAYFRKNEDDPGATPPVFNSWQVHLRVNGQEVSQMVDPDGDPSDPANLNPFLGGLQFQTDGRLPPLTGMFNGLVFEPPQGVEAGADIMVFDFDMSNSTQFGSNFSVTQLAQDGYTTGQVRTIDVGGDGRILVRYTNGQSQALGQILLANFPNAQGLQALGDTVWAETIASGAAVVSAPQTGGLGTIQSGALEESNVDLTESLIRMIIAQRNFQANAQMIRTTDTVTQTIIQIR